MKPPMNQMITAHIATLDAAGKPIPDKYGRPQTSEKTSKARVQFKSQVVKDAQGVEHRVSLEIDIPPGFNPDVGTAVDYATIDNRAYSGTIRAKEEATNIPATKVYYRTIFVDG